MYYKLHLLTKTWLNCYEGEGEGVTGGEGGTGTGTDTKGTDGKGGEGGEGNKGATGSNGNGTIDDDKPTLSQKQLNKILAEEKRKHQTIIQKQVTELEQLKKSKNLTDKEKTDLQSRIEELQNSLLTKEQLTEKERKKLAEEHKRALDTISTEREQWKGLFQKSTIERTIMDAAVKAEAFSPSQIVALLGNSTRLVEVLDEAGSPVPGEFQAKTRFKDVDEHGKPVTLELTVEEAIQRMKDRTDDYGNLFKSNLTGGLGSTGSKTKQGDIDPSKLTPAEYRRWRNKRLGRKENANEQ